MVTEVVPAVVGVGIPVVGGVVTMGLFAWNREMRRRYKKDLGQELAQRKALLGGAYILRPEGELWRRSQGCGQIALLCVGTYAARQLPFILRQFERAGAGDHVGVIYLLELDEDERQMCFANLPPSFRPRVVLPSCPLASGGMLGDRVEDAEEGRELWEHDVMEGAQRWMSRLQAETRPVLLLCLLSPGGMAAVGQPVLEAFHQRYPRLPVYVTTILDHKTVVRQRFPEIRQLYCQDGLVRGNILMDNRRSSQRSDLGIAMLFAAMVGATWIGQLPLELWNGAAYVFPKEKVGGFATISVWAEMLPVYHHPAWEKALPEVFYTKAELVEEKAMRGIRAVVERPELQSIPLEPAEPGSTRLCYVIAPIVPEPDFKAGAQRIGDSLEGWRVKTDQDLLIHYASIAAPINPSTPETPIVVVLLQAIKDSGERIDELARGAEVDSKFLPRRNGPRAIEHDTRRQIG